MGYGLKHTHARTLLFVVAQRPCQTRFPLGRTKANTSAGTRCSGESTTQVVVELQAILLPDCGILPVRFYCAVSLHSSVYLCIREYVPSQSLKLYFKGSEIGK